MRMAIGIAIAYIRLEKLPILNLFSKIHVSCFRGTLNQIFENPQEERTRQL